MCRVLLGGGAPKWLPLIFCDREGLGRREDAYYLGNRDRLWRRQLAVGCDAVVDVLEILGGALIRIGALAHAASVENARPRGQKRLHGQSKVS